jgi:hypothetical protein
MQRTKGKAPAAATVEALNTLNHLTKEDSK